MIVVYRDTDFEIYRMVHIPGAKELLASIVWQDWFRPRYVTGRRLLGHPSAFFASPPKRRV